MTEEQLRAIKERVSKATEGPWAFDTGKKERMDRRPAVIEVFVPEHNEWFINGDISNLEDAEFIAHAREDVPALIAEVERLRKALDASDKHLTTAERHLRDFKKFEYEERTEKERLRDALEEYAAKENYEREANNPDIYEGGYSQPTWEPSWIELDNGETARKTLAGESK